MIPVLSSFVGDHPEIIPAIFCAVGLIFVALGVIMLVRARRFARRAVRTTGDVVDLARRWSNPGGPGNLDSLGNSDSLGNTGGLGSTGSYLYFPVVRFATADGQAVQFQSSTGTSWRSRRVGQTVPVLYNPANPRDARIDTFMATGCLPVGFIVFGAVFVALGGAILLAMNWWAHNGPPR